MYLFKLVKGYEEFLNYKILLVNKVEYPIFISGNIPKEMMERFSEYVEAEKIYDEKMNKYTNNKGGDNA